jgi:ATP-binding cassette subfamily C protein CydC
LVPIIPVKSREIQSGDLLSRVVSDVEALQDFFVRVIAPPFISLLVSGLYLLFLSFYSSELAFALGLIYILSGIVVPLIIIRVSNKYEQRIFELKSELTKNMIETVQGLNEIIMLRQAEKQKQLLEDKISKIAEKQKKSAAVTTLNTSIAAFFTNFGPWVALLITIPLIESHDINGVMLAVLVLSSFASFEMINQLSLSAEYLQRSLNSAERIFEIIDLDEEKGKKIRKEEIINLERIVISDLSFTYSDIDDFGLKGIDLELEPGKKIALVGPSGAGKTTIINLLMGFWEANSGSYKINSIDEKEISKESLINIFSVCEQDAYIFTGTLRSNLNFDSDAVDPELIDKVIDYVQLRDLVDELPDGLNTWVGEHGKTFSAGERQRIFLARTLMKNSDVLIFDEPTSNLDAINEREIIRMITNLDGERPVILITHRLVGMQEMDEILLIDAGQVKERGTHAELIVKGGEYSQMWEIQRQLIKSS